MLTILSFKRANLIFNKVTPISNQRFGSTQVLQRQRNRDTEVTETSRISLIVKVWANPKQRCKSNSYSSFQTQQNK